MMGGLRKHSDSDMFSEISADIGEYINIFIYDFLLCYYGENSEGL